MGIPEIIIIATLGIFTGLIISIQTRTGLGFFFKSIAVILGFLFIVFLTFTVTGSYQNSTIFTAIYFVSAVITFAIIKAFLLITRQFQSPQSDISSLTKQQQQFTGANSYPAHYQTPNAGAVIFIGDVNTRENIVILGREEVPLDNRFGSNTLESEHEFSQKANRTVRLTRNSETTGRFQAGFWTVLEAEARTGLSHNLGIDLQQEEFRRVILRLKADPGKLVLYRVLWKQTQRIGEVEINVQGQVVRLPYVAVYGLSHSVESVSQQL